MECMFSSCTSLRSLTFGTRFDVSKVTDMGSMFEDCENLESVDLGSSKATELRNTDSMFCGCSALETVDLSALRRGIYMVSVNQRFTFKLMKP